LGKKGGWTSGKEDQPLNPLIDVSAKQEKKLGRGEKKKYGKKGGAELTLTGEKKRPNPAQIT